MGFFSSRAHEANERRVARNERRGEARGERIADRADRARAGRVARGSRSPFRSSTFVTRRGR